MIRKTLFNNVGKALRESLNDVEAAALGLWLAQSAGVHLSGYNQYKKDPAILTALEQQLGERFFFKDKVLAKLDEDEILDSGSLEDNYALDVANTRTQEQTIHRVGAAVGLLAAHVKESKRGTARHEDRDDEEEEAREEGAAMTNRARAAEDPVPTTQPVRDQTFPAHWNGQFEQARETLVTMQAARQQRGAEFIARIRDIPAIQIEAPDIERIREQMTAARRTE